MFGLRACHIIYNSSGRLHQNWSTGGDATVNMMEILAILNGPVNRHPLGINLFVDKFLLQELIPSEIEGVVHN